MIKQLLNIGVAVNDIESAMQTYVDNYGGVVVKEIQAHEGLNIRFGVVRVGDADIEFLQPLPGEAILRRYLDTRGEGLFRLAFRTDDLQADVSVLTERGVRSAIVPGPTPIAMVSAKAACGVVFELIERDA